MELAQNRQQGDTFSHLFQCNSWVKPNETSKKQVQKKPVSAVKLWYSLNRRKEWLDKFTAEKKMTNTNRETTYVQEIWATSQKRLKKYSRKIYYYMLAVQHPAAVNHTRTRVTPLTSLLKTQTTLNWANTVSRGKGLPPQSQSAIEIKAGRMNPPSRTQRSRKDVCLNLLISFTPSHIIWLLSEQSITLVYSVIKPAFPPPQFLSLESSAHQDYTTSRTDTPITYSVKDQTLIGNFRCIWTSFNRFSRWWKLILVTPFLLSATKHISQYRCLQKAERFISMNEKLR